MNKIIYLHLHHKDTRKAINEHVKQHNQKLTSEWKADEKAFVEKYCAMFLNAEHSELYEANPEGFKKMYPIRYNKAVAQTTLKSCKIKYQTLTVVFKVLDSFSISLLKNESSGITDPQFRTSNGHISGALNVSKVTVWRHIKRATYCGIFDYNGYEWHGSNSSYNLMFNPSILVACHNRSYSDFLAESWIKNVNNPPISVHNTVDFLAARPSFLDAPYGCMISSCIHIVPVKTFQEQDINMDKAINVENSEMAVAAATEKFSFRILNIDEALSMASAIEKNKNLQQEQGNMGTPAQKMATAVNPELAEGLNKQEPTPGAKKSKAAEKDANDLLNFYLEMSLKIALRVLYADRFIEESDIFTARQHLRKYYSGTGDKKLSQLYTDFNLIIYESHKSKSRNLYIPAPIYKYFDPQFNGGFYRTLIHVETLVKPYLEKNVEYSKSIKDLIKLSHEHLKNPNDFESYRKATQYLGKKKNKVYLEYFNKCVANSQTIDTNNLKNIFQQQN